MDYIKVGGHWKQTTDNFIKVNGHWEKAVGEYVKVGGHWSDASNLAATKLSYDGTTATDTDGTRYLVNSVEPTTHKAPLHSGEAITLSGDGKIEVPINQGHGSVTVFDHNTKKFEQVGADGVGSKELVVNGDFSDGLNSWDFVHASVTANNNTALFTNAPAGKDVIRQTFKAKVGSTYMQKFSFSNINSGGSIKFYSTNGGGDSGYKTTNGDYSFSYVATKDTITSRCRVGAKLSGNLDNISVKEVLPLAPTYTLKEGTFGTIIKLDTNTFSQADLTAFNARPELVLEWSAGTATIPSAIVKGAKDEIVVPTITGTHTTINTSQFGIQQIKVGTGAMNGKDDGRFIQLPLVSNGKHLLKVCTKLIAGDITNVTDTPC